MNEANEPLRKLRQLPKYKAPANLRDKLMAIPQKYPRTESFMERFKRIAPIGIAAAIILLFMGLFPGQQAGDDGDTYSQTDIEDAQQGLALAFHYLNDLGQEAGEDVNDVVVNSSKRAILHGMFYPVLNNHANHDIKSGEQR